MRLKNLLAVMMFTAAFVSMAHAGSVTPELDPGVVGSAFMLIGGAALVIRGRRRK